MKNKINDIVKWWAENPMTYGLVHGTSVYRDNDKKQFVEIGSHQFFEYADKQLFEWNKPLHNKTGRFGKIFPYKKYQNCAVLEIGCGMGGMAMLWAQRGAQITAVDLNPVAVEQTKRRFALFHLSGSIQKEDVNHLSFSNETFDYVYSWGVLHHSPNFERSISEIFRVLKPRGEFGLMLYHRHSLYYWYHIVYVEGFLHNEFRFLNELQLASRYGDGHRQEGNPYTWPITKREIKKSFLLYAHSLKIRLLGTELDSTFKLMLPGVYSIVPRIVKKAWARRFGWSFWISGKKVEK